jgi:hypothetical protein
MAQEHSALKKICNDYIEQFRDRYVSANAKVFDDPVEAPTKKKKSVPEAANPSF